MKVRIIASINLWTNANPILTRTLRSIFGRPRRVGRVLSSMQKQLRCTVHPDYARRRRHWLRWC